MKTVIATLILRSRREIDAQELFECAGSVARHAERAAVAFALDPLAFERGLSERRARQAGDMWTAFAPIQTRTANDAASASVCELDVQAPEQRHALVGQRACGVGKRYCATFDQSIGESNAEPSGQMVVAKTGCREIPCNPPLGRVTRGAPGCERHQRLERVRNVRRCNAVIAAASLREHGEQLPTHQTLQM